MDIKKFFRRKEEGKAQEQTAQPHPLAIEGIPPAPLTPEPDEAEIAAQALLEHLSEECRVKSKEFATARGRHRRRKDTDPTRTEVVGHASKRDGRGKQSSEASPTMQSSEASPTMAQQHKTRNAEYYRHLAAKMRVAREATRLRVKRFLAFCEQELKKPHLPTFGEGSLGLLEAELYKRLDIVEHEGGELLRRWQHCLALVTVRMMQATRKNDNENENSFTTEGTDSSSTTN
jgi:hypothetical protein